LSEIRRSAELQAVKPILGLFKSEQDQGLVARLWTLTALGIRPAINPEFGVIFPFL